MTTEESLEIIEKHITEKQKNLMGFKNHRSWNLEGHDTFRFTVKILSLEFLLSLMEDDKVKNVFFNPSNPPPGGGTDSISMRYKVYVEYY